MRTPPRWAAAANTGARISGWTDPADSRNWAKRSLAWLATLRSSLPKADMDIDLRNASVWLFRLDGFQPNLANILEKCGVAFPSTKPYQSCECDMLSSSNRFRPTFASGMYSFSSEYASTNCR